MTQHRIRRLGYDEDADGSRWSRLGVQLTMLAVLLGAGWATYQAFFASRGDERIVQIVELLGPTPEQKKESEPEPPPEDEEVEVPDVDIKPPGPEEAAPTDNRLGLDVEAGVGGDGFGLLAKKGGRDITTLGADGDGGLGNPLLLQAFVNSIRAEVQRELNEHMDLRRRSYVATVKVWVGRDGTVERFEVSQPPGQRDLDLALDRALAELHRVSDPPPGMPQPVWLRIRSTKTTG